MNWPDMSQVPNQAPEFKEAALCVNSEIIKRGESPSNFLPEINDLQNGFIIFHLHQVGRKGGLDIGYDKKNHIIVGVQEWQDTGGVPKFDATTVLHSMQNKPK